MSTIICILAALTLLGLLIALEWFRLAARRVTEEQRQIEHMLGSRLNRSERQLIREHHADAAASATILGDTPENRP